MRGLQAAVIFMGVVIVAMVATIVVTLAHRMSAPPPPVASVVLLDQPAGTRIYGISAVGDRLAVLLQGGGPDRIVFLDPAGKQIAGTIALRR